MADFAEEIRRQPKRPLSPQERQGLRYMLELFYVRGRLWIVFWKWVGYLSGGVGLAAAVLTAWEKFIIAAGVH